MWRLTSIPQIAHFYWGGGPLSYLRYLTLESFRRANPDWRMILHTSHSDHVTAPTWEGTEQSQRYQGPDHQHLVEDLDVELVRHDFESMGFTHTAHEVHKADYLRWRLLWEQGGLWSDMDIIYLRGMDCLLENRTAGIDFDVGLVPLIGSKKHTVGFMLAKPGTEFFQSMHQQCLSQFQSNSYQCMGSDLLNAFPDLASMQEKFPNDVIRFLEKKCVYRITSKRIGDFYRPYQETQEPFHRRSILGFHWYGGHPLSNEFENQIAVHNNTHFDNTLGTIIKEALS